MPLDTRHRPRESDVRQQRVPAWKPVFSDKLFYFLFGAVAITFIAVGIPMLYRSTLVVEKSWEYTDCIANISGPAQSCSNLLGDVTQPWHNNSNMERCQCVIDISLSGFSGKTTYLFYQLDNYYQDHRFYVISRWDVQLRSDSIAGGTDCDPITSDPFGRPYAPCGEIANSIFNDTISLQKADGSAVVLSGSGIAWDSDVGGKYKNPSYSGDLCNFPGWAPSAVATPPNWPVRACELGKDTDPAYNPWHPRFGSSGRGYENQDFIVWMRVAGTPSFRKPYRKIVGDLPDGVYRFVVDYNYPVTPFHGKKTIVLSTTSWMSGQNPFLGIMFILVGFFSILTVAALALMKTFGTPREPQW